MTRGLLCCIALGFVPACRGAAPPADAAPDAVTAPADVVPAAQTAPEADARAALPGAAPSELEDPPLAVDPAPTVWTAGLVPEPVRVDARSLALLEAVAADGLAPHVDPALAVVWDDDGVPRPVAGSALAVLSGPLEALLAAARVESVCVAGTCAVADGATRWFIMVRRNRGGRAPVVAAVLRATGWPESRRYVAWEAAARSGWQSPTLSLIGDGLSAAEGGRYAQALATFTQLAQADPENPWALYYIARTHVELKQYREAYIIYRLLAEHPAASAVTAQLRVGSDGEMARFRTHSAVKAVQRELELPPPDDAADFVAYLRRFRAVEARLAEVISADGPPVGAVAQLVEAHLLDPAVIAATPLAVQWTGARLALRRNALGALEITALSEATLPASAPPARASGRAGGPFGD